MVILKVCESNKSCVGNFDWAFAWSFAVGKMRKIKKRKRKKGVVRTIFLQALET